MNRVLIIAVGFVILVMAIGYMIEPEPSDVVKERKKSVWIAEMEIRDEATVDGTVEATAKTVAGRFYYYKVSVEGDEKIYWAQSTVKSYAMGTVVKVRRIVLAYPAGSAWEQSFPTFIILD